MNGVRTTKATALLVLLVGALLVIALTPASALAAWTDARASIVDPLGTGVVPFLNVGVTNHASNDTSHVTTRPVLRRRPVLVRRALHRPVLRLGAGRGVRAQGALRALRRGGRQREPGRHRHHRRRHRRPRHAGPLRPRGRGWPHRPALRREGRRLVARGRHPGREGQGRDQARRARPCDDGRPPRPRQAGTPRRAGTRGACWRPTSPAATRCDRWPARSCSADDHRRVASAARPQVPPGAWTAIPPAVHRHVRRWPTPPAPPRGTPRGRSRRPRRRSTVRAR